MNEQLKAIRNEIERRIKEYNAIIESQPDSNLCERYACKWAEGKSLLSFIDSMPEETDNEEPNHPMLSDSLEAAREAANEVYCYTTQTMDDLVGLFLSGA